MLPISYSEWGTTLIGEEWTAKTRALGGHSKHVEPSQQRGGLHRNLSCDWFPLQPPGFICQCVCACGAEALAKGIGMSVAAHPDVESSTTGRIECPCTSVFTFAGFAVFQYVFQPEVAGFSDRFSNKFFFFL